MQRIKSLQSWQCGLVNCKVAKVLDITFLRYWMEEQVKYDSQSIGGNKAAGTAAIANRLGMLIIVDKGK